VSKKFSLGTAAAGARVGIVDADILGPSYPGMLRHHQPVEEAERRPGGKELNPAEQHGLKVGSAMAMLTGDDEPACFYAAKMVWEKYLKIVSCDGVSMGIAGLT